MRTCSVPDCGRKHYGRGYCSMHYQRWHRHGDPLALGYPTGPEHWNWSDVDASYMGVHKRLARVRGLAAEHLCTHCAGAASQWAYDHCDPQERIGDDGHGKSLRYSTDLDRYIPLCATCHVAFDAAARAA